VACERASSKASAKSWRIQSMTWSPTRIPLPRWLVR
jgi:hypothetical protein